MKPESAIETQILELVSGNRQKILPIYSEAVMMVLGRESGLGFKACLATIYAVFCAAIWWLNQFTVKKHLLPLKAELDQTLQGIPESNESSHE